LSTFETLSVSPAKEIKLAGRDGAPIPNTFGVANLESPSDDVLHLAVGVWALYAAFIGKEITPATARK
jgi:hypothetical protein